MKKNSTLLLSSAVLMASLAQSPLVSAQTTTSTETSTKATSQTTSRVLPPQTTQSATTTKIVTEVAAPIPQAVSKVNAPLTTEQNGQTLSIFYNRSTEQKNHKIQYAVWSTENGQDDVKWYVAGDRQTDIPLSQHKGYGQYIIHSYITVQGKLIFIEESSATVTKPTPSITTAVSDPGVLDVRIQNLPAHLAEVRVPIWSSKNEQDDLKWYTARYNPDGSYSLRVYLKDHKFDTGTYSIHLYTKETTSSALGYVSASSFTIGKAHIPTKQEPAISLKDIQKTKGTYTIVVQEKPSTKRIKQVDVATWSTANQSNIKWRKASLQNGSYQTSINFQEHQAMTGHYQNHVYVTYEDGSKLGYTAQTVDLSAARLPIQFSNHLTHTGNMGITIKNVYDNTPVQYAVWSDANGQDDIAWYTATKSADKTFTGNIPLHNHNGTGKYHVHVYQGNTGLGAFTMQVNQSHRVTEANTYPVGQCTWGVKELAPWVRNYWGNANQWGCSARAAGFKTGSTPRVGAVAVWTGGFYGHVAVVTEVASPTSIRVKEANYAGKQYIGDFRGWFNPIADGVTEYIYPN